MHTPIPWAIRPESPTTVSAADGKMIALVVMQVGTHAGEDNRPLIIAAPEMLRALKCLADWRMRDGTPCFCPAGKDEDEPKGRMPTLHSTSCEIARAAIARATGEE